ncbi:MAG TPA: hypothetical protein VMV19_12660 [Xanthobacteraceae bacterium]|nr:hypothetical protein [Xanthobacteraceae bacterium]
MVVDEGLAEEYRRQAVRIRVSAEKATVAEIKAELYKIAAAFERLAEHTEKKRPGG